jgi:hypothetical protein
MSRSGCPRHTGVYRMSHNRIQTSIFFLLLLLNLSIFSIILTEIAGGDSVKIVDWGFPSEK